MTYPPMRPQHGGTWPPPRQQPPAPKRRRGWLKWVLLVVGVLLVLVVVAGNTAPAPVAGPAGAPSTTSTATASSGPVPAAAGITYRVEGQGKVTLTYITNGGMSQVEATLPWELAGVDVDALPTVTATRTSGRTGPVQCVILRDGAEIARTQASGQYASCTATGQLFE